MEYTDKQSKSGPASTSQGIQCSYLGCTNRSYLKDDQGSRFHFFKMPMNNPLKNIWCNRIEKMDGKYGFVVTKNSNVCHVHFATEDILGVPGGKRWRLRDAAVPIKADQSLKPCRKKQKTFGMDIKNSNELCRHYTGFLDCERLKLLFVKPISWSEWSECNDAKIKRD